MSRSGGPPEVGIWIKNSVIPRPVFVAGVMLQATIVHAEPINLLPVAPPAPAHAAGSGTLTALPSPPVPDSAPPRAFLLAARTAVEQGRSGEAEEALERAETRLLDRFMSPGLAREPGPEKAASDVASARHFLAARDRLSTIVAIDAALARLDATPIAQLPPTAASPLSPLSIGQTAEPTVTYALLPGHWELHGANYVWVPPDRHKRRIETANLVEGRYVWKNGTYVWVATHFDR